MSDFIHSYVFIIRNSPLPHLFPPLFSPYSLPIYIYYKNFV